MNKELTPHEVMKTTLKSLCKISSEFSQAGGNPEILSEYSLFEFIECCARNHIEIDLKYKRD